MGKMQHRRLKQSEQDNESWMSGFINLFDFRRGGSNQRLLLDKRIVSKVRGEDISLNMSHRVDSECQFEYDDYVKREFMVGPRKQSVNNLIDGEMVDKGRGKQNCNDSFMGFVDFANDADINNLVREILIRIQKKSSREVEHEQDNFYSWPAMIRAKFVEQLSDATKILLHEKLIGRVHVGLNGKIQYSRQFIDALVTLMNHKDLLFKLLEDSNSELSRRVNNLVNSELQKSADKKESDAYHHEKNSQFSAHSNFLFEPVPEALSNSNSISSSGSGLEIKSSFTFTEIKRMLKRAMGKDKEEVYARNGLIRSTSRRDSFGRMSPITNPHLEVEIHPKRISNPELNDIESLEKPDMPFMNENVQSSEEKTIIRDVELKKTSYHMLTDESSHDNFFKWRDLEFTRKSLSMPNHNSSPSHTVRQSSISTTYIRSTSQVLDQENNVNATLYQNDKSLVGGYREPDDKWSTRYESLASSPLRLENIVFSDGEYEEKFSFEGSAAITNANYDEQDVIDIDYTTPSPAISTYSDLVSDKTDKFNDVTSKMEHQPSSISVLEAENGENEVSQPRTKYLHSKISIHFTISIDFLLKHNYLTPHASMNLTGELQVVPLQIQFEEEEEDMSESDSRKSQLIKKSCDDNDSKLSYLKKVLIASGFSWDTLYVRYLSSDQLLHVSSDDAEVDVQSDQQSNDNLLLVDMLNEVLEATCARYFGCYPWVSLSKPNIRTISDTAKTFEEILEEVDSHLHSSSHPQHLEDIVTNDLYKDGRYTDFQSDFGIIGTEIADLILQKLLIDTTLSCFSYADRPQIIHL